MMQLLSNNFYSEAHGKPLLVVNGEPQIGYDYVRLFERSDDRFYLTPCNTRIGSWKKNLVSELERIAKENPNGFSFVDVPQMAAL